MNIDAACDLDPRLQQRGVADLCLGMGIDDAYLSVRELAGRLTVSITVRRGRQPR